MSSFSIKDISAAVVNFYWATASGHPQEAVVEMAKAKGNVKSRLGEAWKRLAPRTRTSAVFLTKIGATIALFK